MSKESGENERQKALAVMVVNQATDAERHALKAWALQLLELQRTDMPRLSKAKAAIQLTAAAKVIWPAARITAGSLKKVGWDDRSRSARLGLSGAALGIAVAGGQSAGIAALGTAVAVPLWVVFGAGAMFANHLVELIQGKDHNTLR